MDATISVSRERFAQGLTMQQYIESMEKNKDLFVENYNAFTLNPEDEAFLRSLNLHSNVLVLTEDWCGDAIRYVPVLARISEAVKTWEVRLFQRDSNPDLAGVWLKDGKYGVIPAMVFFDEEMNEFANFIEKPALVYEEEARARAAFADQHPELPDARLHVSEMSEPTRELYTTHMRQFVRENKSRFQQFFVEELRTKLEEALTK